jgi:hypothetical protein
MKRIKDRILDLSLPANRSAFLWGPHKTGKTYWINRHFADSVIIDLLKTGVFADYASRPSLLRERYQEHKGLIVIDEIQMVPDLLNEIHSFQYSTIPRLPDGGQACARQYPAASKTSSNFPTSVQIVFQCAHYRITHLTGQFNRYLGIFWGRVWEIPWITNFYPIRCQGDDIAKQLR